jgi:hypothetical protein
MLPLVFKHYKRLLGRTIVQIAEDDEDDTAGFILDNGDVVWVMCDPEGNGPGFLDIVKAKDRRA